MRALTRAGGTLFIVRFYVAFSVLFHYFNICPMESCHYALQNKFRRDYCHDIHPVYPEVRRNCDASTVKSTYICLLFSLNKHYNKRSHERYRSNGVREYTGAGDPCRVHLLH